MTIRNRYIRFSFKLWVQEDRGLCGQRRLGERLGRPPGPGKSKLDPYRLEIEALLRNGATKTFVAKRYGANAANLHLWLKKRLRNQTENNRGSMIFQSVDNRMEPIVY